MPSNLVCQLHVAKSAVTIPIASRLRYYWFIFKLCLLCWSQGMTMFFYLPFLPIHCCLHSLRGLSCWAFLLQSESVWDCSCHLLQGWSGFRWRFSTAWYGKVRFGTAQFWRVFHWIQYMVPGTSFSTTSTEVPSEPYRYQNVTCKPFWSLIGHRESYLHHWTCDTRYQTC